MSEAREPDPIEVLESLAGLVLNDNWKLAELIKKRVFQTGSCFSVGYKVHHKDGIVAFAKVLDFSRALQEDDSAAALDRLLKEYLFERELLRRCDGLTRIVKGLDYGDIPVSGVPLGRLYYIIFEMAEGDVRRYIGERGLQQLSLRLRILHDVATGLAQLHKRGVCHQDLKPSNVLLFSDERAKLADLGRSFCADMDGPHDAKGRPGAFHYAPPEQLYNYQIADRLPYRHSADLYLLGSMLDFFVTGSPTTVRLVDALEDIHRPFGVAVNGWRGFFQDVLPFLQAAHAEIAREFRSKAQALLGRGGNRDAVDTMYELYVFATDPDPLARGHPRAKAEKHSSDYDLQRFIAGFDILSKKIAIIEKQAHAN